ncbi:hypothetical protein B0J11DRAFT_503712 [Dendryphion nanum]|uniref:Uncharacterized protein n=1 Tax=Dendryphion nanum TaxID=256645 RepID=A0A9P9IVR2_9PLEO|nr:hypothetical protein B0J11DRAFT_503712 [Dendryphion nanum]
MTLILSVSWSFIHHAVRTSKLAELVAAQIFLLATANITDEELELEQAVFEGREFYGPHDFTYRDLPETPTTSSKLNTRIQEYTNNLVDLVAGGKCDAAFDRPISTYERKMLQAAESNPLVGMYTQVSNKIN